MLAVITSGNVPPLGINDTVENVFVSKLHHTILESN